MAVTANDVKLLAPEFEGQQNKRINLFISWAEACVNREKFDDKADQAVTLLAAHKLSLASRGGAGGSITSEKVGDIQVNYGQSQSDRKELASTAYGSMFVELLRALPCTPLVVNTCR